MKKYILGIIAIAIIVTISAFSMSVKTYHKVPSSTVWYYNGSGTTQADFQNGLNWNTTNVGNCVDDAPKPCHISADATTQSALSSYLSGFSKQQILNMSTGRKE